MRHLQIIKEPASASLWTGRHINIRRFIADINIKISVPGFLTSFGMTSTLTTKFRRGNFTLYSCYVIAGIEISGFKLRMELRVNIIIFRACCRCSLDIFYFRGLPCTAKHLQRRVEQVRSQHINTRGRPTKSKNLMEHQQGRKPLWNTNKGKKTRGIDDFFLRISCENTSFRLVHRDTHQGVISLFVAVLAGYPYSNLSSCNAKHLRRKLTIALLFIKLTIWNTKKGKKNADLYRTVIMILICYPL